MESGTMMLVQLFLSLFGSAYLLYGWRQKKLAATAAGLLVCVLPMVIGNLAVLLSVCVVLLVVPWFLRI